MESTHLLWKDPAWPHLRYDRLQVGQELALARRAQGLVEGKLAAMGFKERQALAADAWTQEAMSTSAIEGEHLDLLAVRSSVARRLGTGSAKGGRTPRHVDGLLDSMDDAVIHAHAPLSHKRLQAWQAALFPTGFAGLRQIRVGDYRKHAMQIVSGPAGRETVHYEAPPARRVPAEMRRLVDWLNAGSESDRLVQAGLAHLWFETIHPFDDGNGRVGRVLVDLILARDSGQASRLMRISQRFLDVRDEYYAQLERAQHGTVDVTAWLLWFVAQVRVACDQASSVIDASLQKAHFWSTHREKGLTDRMRKVINTLLDAGPGGFEGGMSTRKYESLTGASRAIASRDLIDLAQMGLLRPVGAGRATRYYINMDAWYPAGDGQH